jgi:hypothetical protein
LGVERHEKRHETDGGDTRERERERDTHTHTHAHTEGAACPTTAELHLRLHGARPIATVSLTSTSYEPVSPSPHELTNCCMTRISDTHLPPYVAPVVVPNGNECDRCRLHLLIDDHPRGTTAATQPGKIANSRTLSSSCPATCVFSLDVSVVAAHFLPPLYCMSACLYVCLYVQLTPYIDSNSGLPRRTACALL